MKMKSVCVLLAVLGLVQLAGRSWSQDAPPDVDLRIVAEPPPEETAKDTHAGTIEAGYEIPDDFWTHGVLGDTILKNDFAGFTFGAVSSDQDKTNDPRSGSILDIFPDPASPEGLQLIQPSTSASGNGRTVVVKSIATSRAADGSARVTVTGDDRTTSLLAVDTIYEMKKGWPGVLATTTITNDSDEERKVDAASDFVGWGAMVPFAAGTGWINRNTITSGVEFVFARYEDSYVFIMPMKGSCDFHFNQIQSSIIYGKDITLKAGESYSYQRWILTNTGDPSKLYSFVVKQRGKASYGFLAGRIQERVKLPDGRVVESDYVPNAEVRLSIARRADLPLDYAGKPYLFAITDQQGNFQFCLPPGEYLVAATSNSRLFEPSNMAIKVEGGGKISAVDMPVSKASTLSFEISDADSKQPLPGKISFVPLRGTMAPDLGPPGGLISGKAVYTLTGRGLIEVPAGDYRVMASHGVEYHMQEKRVHIEQAAAQSVSFELTRAYKPDGWISADVGVMTSVSPQSRIDPYNRVASAVAEGLQWIVTADLDRPTNLQPIVTQLGAEKEILASPGMRLSSSKEFPRGEFLLFPTDICSAGPSADFSGLLKTKTTKDAIDVMRSLCPNAVIVANRPIFPEVGLLTLQGYDFQTGRFPDKDLVADVDAYQVWEGKRQLVVDQALMTYYALLGRGYKLTPIADSLSAGTYNEEPGYPRIYIPSDTADPRKFDVENFAREIKDGRVMITNGPYIDLKVNGESMGSLITDTDKVVDIELRVYTPNWASVSDIQINLNGTFMRKFLLPAGSVDPEAGLVFPKKDEDRVIQLQVPRDSVLNVVVKGDPELLQDPVNPLELPTVDPKVPKGQTSMAISAPIYIDVDGNGVLDLDPNAFANFSKQEKEPYVPPF